MTGLVLANSTVELLPSILSAIFAGTATIILALLSWRSQSYRQLLKDIEDLVAELLRLYEERRRTEDRRTIKEIKHTLRETLGPDDARRRLYNPPDEE